MLGIERRVGETLVESGIISEEQLLESLVVSEREGKRLRNVLYEKNLVGPFPYITALSFQTKLPIVDLAHTSCIPTSEALRAIPEDMATRLNVLPLSVEKDYIRVVMDDPTDLDALKEITTYTGKRVKRNISWETGIPFAIQFSYTGKWREYRGRILFSSYGMYKTSEQTILTASTNQQTVSADIMRGQELRLLQDLVTFRKN